MSLETAALQLSELVLRVRVALAFFDDPPDGLEALGPLHHVGFIASDPNPLKVFGFALLEVYESKRVARELKVPTTVRRYQRGQQVLEVFVPEAPTHQVKDWIAKGVAYHLAFETSDLAKAPAGWTAVGEPVDVAGCRVLYYEHPDVSYRLELFQCS